VQGIPGPLQEWLEDFNSALATGESRADNAVDRSLFCGSGTTGASDLLDYPAFLRHAFRSSLDARYSLSNLGFRGVVRTSPTPRAVAAAATTPVRDASIYAPDVSLMDAHGRWTRLADLRGRLVVATMVYTSCQSVCPMITARLKDIERRLPPALRARVTFALFSLDPGRDTPAALAAFAAAHDLDAERWQLLAASDANVRTLSVLFGVKYAGDRNGSLVHSAVIVVLDPDGIIRHRETGTVADSAAVVAALTRIPR
jgi:protein SCO1/2